MFKAVVLKDSDSGVSASVESLSDAALNENTDGDTVIDVEYSTINYKDGLAICRGKPIVRKWPMVPGIDLSGVVVSCESGAFEPGDRVVLNGWGVGESHWGGLSQRAKIKAELLIPLPAELSSMQAMAIGTAGYTAMLCVMKLQQQGVQPGDGDILVTGAAGGVGSVAISVLAANGYQVVASTGRLEESDYLRQLGAKEVIDRTVIGGPGKPLQKERWAGVIDSVGSYTLVNACAQTKYLGTVVCCGLAQGMDFPATVAPFILRGIKLIGVDSVMCPRSDRELAWRRLAAELPTQKLQAITQEVALTDVVEHAKQVLAGKVRGRIVVDVNA